MFAPLWIVMLAAQPGLGRPVAPGTADASPLGSPLALTPLSLEVDADFSRVYELDDAPGLFGRPGGKRYARKAGAVTAIFPRSSYVDTAGGPVALIPNDTVFMIGEPTPTREDRGVEKPNPLAADLRAAPPTAPREVDSSPRLQTPARPSSRYTSLWTDAAYREQRLGAILDAVAHR